MLTEKEAEEKLRGMAQEFQDLMKQRQYGKAKARYEVARSVAVTMELSEDIKEELFGVRGGKGEICLLYTSSPERIRSHWLPVRPMESIPIVF